MYTLDATRACLYLLVTTTGVSSGQLLGYYCTSEESVWKNSALQSWEVCNSDMSQSIQTLTLKTVMPFISAWEGKECYHLLIKAQQTARGWQKEHLSSRCPMKPSSFDHPPLKPQYWLIVFCCRKQHHSFKYQSSPLRAPQQRKQSSSTAIYEQLPILTVLWRRTFWRSVAYLLLHHFRCYRSNRMALQWDPIWIPVSLPRVSGSKSSFKGWLYSGLKEKESVFAGPDSFL